MSAALNNLLTKSNTNVRATITSKPEGPELVLAVDEIKELNRKLDVVHQLINGDKETGLNFMKRLDK